MLAKTVYYYEQAIIAFLVYREGLEIHGQVLLWPFRDGEGV